MSFVHLAVRTEYSITDSIVRIDSLVQAAKQDGQTSLGMADVSNLFAVIKFYKACISEGIKPLIGTEMTICNPNDKFNQGDYSIVLYAMDNEGYKNLLQLVSQGYMQGLKDGTPTLTKEELFAQSQGVIVILTERSDINIPLKSNHPERAATLLQDWQKIYGDRVYIGVKRTNRAEENSFIKNAIIHASPLGIPLVAYNDVRFLEQDDFDAHEARVCIASGYVLGDTTRPRTYSEEQYFKTSEQMTALFADIPTVIANTYALACRCNVTLTLGKSFLPNFPIPKGETIDSFLTKTSFEGLHERLAKLYPIENRGDDWSKIYAQYEKRLNYELGVIIQMGFPGYFLIVMDFIGWAKDNDIPVGPGRGSGAGSLVAYALKITDLDPLAYDLLFERFLNPERVSMPDFDIDFCIEGRDRVIEYVAQKYGREAVSQIITFGTMAAKAVVRDVARVQGKSYGLADKISKLIPKTPGISLDKAVEEEPQLKDLLTNPETFDHEDAVEIWEMAQKLEGITRNVGKHAGGVLIAPGRVSDFSAVYSDSEGGIVSQFDKDDVEAAGLVKFDFLGLRNLTVIKDAIHNINERRKNEKQPPLTLEELPLDDANVYKYLLQTAKTSAVFQLESTGMKKYLERLKPSNIEDVIAMCALYRPGPLDAGMVDMYIDRKNGEAVTYDHPHLEPILSNTYGVIVYQEQVMQISQAMAGYTLGGADMLRRAMGKKKPEEMAKQRVFFVEGAKNLGIDTAIAGGVFDLMEKFAGYGFNKSHSAAYGVLAYQTAYLKHYYPAEFMAAVLTSEMNNTDDVVFLIADCEKNFDLSVMPPCVNQSDWKFKAADPNTIIYGLGAVKGVGEGAVESIVNARQAGEFTDLYDFCNRVDIKKAGKRVLEPLVLSGSFDTLACHIAPKLFTANKSFEIRHDLWQMIPQAMKAAEQNLANKTLSTQDLFSEIDDALIKAPPLSLTYFWSAKERLNGELKTLGLYLTGHPIDEYKDDIKYYGVKHALDDLKPATHAKFAGIIMDVANFGNRVVVRLDDGSCRLEISCYLEVFVAHKEILKVGEIVIIEGSVSDYEGRTYHRMKKAYTLTEARLKYVSHLDIKLSSNDGERLKKLLELIKKQASKNYLKRLPIFLSIYNNYGMAKLSTNPSFGLVPTDETMQALKNLLPNPKSYQQIYAYEH